MTEQLDQADFKTLVIAILRQALDDYVKLQHPHYRQKKYLVEAYHNAIDMLFDSEYRLLHIKNEDGEDMSLVDLLRLSTSEENPDVKKLQQYVIDEAVKFWDFKHLNVITIPDTLQINGHVYFIEHGDDLVTYTIDYDNKTITTNRKDNSENQEQLMIAMTELTLHHEDIALPQEEVVQLGKAWFRNLKLNNCFTGTS